eukprot:GILK01007802.1.p1 GENE.GILK01007802.1~~GILK01007802.1.p1  ORF type:complete len:386 (+),score=30.10 GILK01007802.1:43-1158(+)
MSKPSLLFSLGVGQSISILCTGMGVFSQLLAREGSRVPTTQTFVPYCLLTLFLAYRLLKHQPITVVWWKYLFIAFADAEANYLIVKAYQYTTITSVMLLDCSTIPISMILSKWWLKASYTRRHYTGVAIALTGLFCIFLSDLGKEHEAGAAAAPIFGDLLVILAACCYSISNVAQELMIKGGVDQFEYLGMIGLFAACINGVQMVLLDWNDLMRIQWTPRQVWYLFGFAACLVSMYSITPIFMHRCGAVLMNLSLLTADGWAVIASLVIFRDSFPVLYLMGFVIILAGLIVYHKTPETVEVYSIVQNEHTEEDDIENVDHFAIAASDEEWKQRRVSTETTQARHGPTRKKKKEGIELEPLDSKKEGLLTGQ